MSENGYICAILTLGTHNSSPTHLREFVLVLAHGRPVGARSKCVLVEEMSTAVDRGPTLISLNFIAVRDRISDRKSGLNVDV